MKFIYFYGIIIKTYYGGGSSIKISDVAQKAGVSVATVSRVINNANSVSEKTKQNVLSVINELDYHPNFAGRNLRKQKSNVIFVIMNSMINPLFAKIINGIEENAHKNGYNILLCPTDNNPKQIENYLNLINNKVADGTILLSIEIPNTLKKFVTRLSKTSPIVQCCEFQSALHLPVITIDDFKAMYDATNHLISQGRRRILYLSNSNSYTSTIKRYNGYVAALKDNNIEFDERLVIRGNYGFRNAIKNINQFLSLGVSFDGITSNNDRMAAGAISALLAKGYKIPEDVMAIGFDNSSLCYMMSPQLSSISQPQHDIGYQAFETIFNMLNNKPYSRLTTLPHGLVLRKST